MQTVKYILKYIFVFFVTIILLAGILVLSAKIPQPSIMKNVLESAEYLCDGEIYGSVVEGVRGSLIDRYADSILLGIAWQYDSGHPLASVMRSAYYYTEYRNENENLLEAVTNDCEANQQYMRYWHGSPAAYSMGRHTQEWKFVRAFYTPKSRKGSFGLGLWICWYVGDEMSVPVWIWGGRNVCRYSAAPFCGLCGVCLSQKAYLHCFFTYRAQLATILAIVLILEELTDWRWLSHENAGKRKF